VRGEVMKGSAKYFYFEIGKLVIARRHALAERGTCLPRSGKSFSKKEKTLPNFLLDKTKNQEEDGAHR